MARVLPVAMRPVVAMRLAVEASRRYKANVAARGLTFSTRLVVETSSRYKANVAASGLTVAIRLASAVLLAVACITGHTEAKVVKEMW